MTFEWPFSDLWVTFQWPFSDLSVTFQWPFGDLLVSFRWAFGDLLANNNFGKTPIFSTHQSKRKRKFWKNGNFDKIPILAKCKFWQNEKFNKTQILTKRKFKKTQIFAIRKWWPNVNFQILLTLKYNQKWYLKCWQDTSFWKMLILAKR